MFVSLMNWECRPFGLFVKVNETSRTWLHLSLMISIHGAVLCWINFMIMQSVLSSHLLTLHIYRSESIAQMIMLILVAFCKVLFVLPHFIQHF